MKAGMPLISKIKIIVQTYLQNLESIFDPIAHHWGFPYWQASQAGRDMHPHHQRDLAISSTT